MSRWTLQTLDASETYVFEMSPNAQTSPFPSRDITWDFNSQLGWAGTRKGRTPHEWSFSGVLRSQAQYDAMLAWVGKKTKVRLTDDRGDSFVVRLLEFAPAQEGKSRNRLVPWRMTYSVRTLIFEMEEAP